MLSTTALLEISRALLCTKWFNFSTRESNVDLEIHLRCVAASLRLLSARGISRGLGNLRYEIFNEMYDAMPGWKKCHDGQVSKNHNNEFLIVFAQDLIASFPNDRTIAANIAGRAIASAEVLGHAVRAIIKNVR